uniref:Uncharacterized protein n=1 Tax=Cyanophora biloba TaxID=1489483 RepID=A0A2Z4HGI1_9EUKA|nr:hypothetical protein [Cyanophora biloba]AWW13900.1 hypothetical protein [Cyanophora biloba]
MYIYVKYLLRYNKISKPNLRLNNSLILSIFRLKKL